MLSHFKLPYTETCHSIQGATIEDKITLFDTNVHDRNYIWTAITRATDFNNVTVFLHDDTQDDPLTKVKTKQYFAKKIEHYKVQDTRAGRVWNEDNYVDLDWILQEWRNNENKCCPMCGDPFEKYFDENNIIRTNITIDRQDNSKCHEKDNCTLCCIKCNVTKR